MSQIFISYARKDHFFVDRLRADLGRADIAYWIDHEGLSPGTRNWERAIRQAIADSEAMIWVVSPSSYASEYVSSELAVGEMHKLNVFPVWADGDNWIECVELGKHKIQYIDMRGAHYEEGLTALLKALKGETPEIAVPPPVTPTLPPGTEPRNPYKGLLAFTEADAGDFFGREALVTRLQEHLMANLDADKARFLAVLGPSGAGKSSVVMAGLLPALKTLHPDWAVLPRMVPGKHPVEALADALYSVMPDKSLAAIESDLNSPGGRMLHRLARQIKGERVVLYLDQFEELFTLTATEDERQQFINLIAQAATEPDGKLIVILSMRADFYGDPLSYPQLGPLVEAHNVGVLPMSITELRDAIEKPARLPDVGLSFDDGLVAEIIFALRERDKALAGALPLLEFTLERLFQQREGNRLTWEAYNALGDPERGISGVEGAIGTHCEDVFSKLPDAAQAQLGTVFLPLVSIDEETGEPTRRRAPLDSLADEAEAKTLVDALVKERLLQAGRDGEATYLEIAHEALFRSWERLVQWIATTRDDLRLLRQVEREAADWDARGRGYLLTVERLQPIHEALARLGYTLNPIAHDFVYPQAMLLAELEKPETDEKRRLRIGDDLDLLGDPREGVGVKEGVPDIVWLPVEGSAEPVTIKTDEREIGPVRIRPFFIAKYQVTYAQYQAFVEAEDGFDNPDWWQDFPEKYRPQELSEQRTKNRNNPRDSVSWYQSVAFARWINHRLRGLALSHPDGVLRVGDNAEIRLPTEWEWQWAAQGGAEAREYPWGGWRRGYANTSESGLGRAIPVGMYPHGAAVCGALDLSGNLFEWCLNDRDNPEITDGYSNNKSKVLRGGSFHHSLYHAAASYRNPNLPYFVYFNFGVRVVLSPLS